MTEYIKIRIILYLVKIFFYRDKIQPDPFKAFCAFSHSKYSNMRNQYLFLYNLSRIFLGHSCYEIVYRSMRNALDPHTLCAHSSQEDLGHSDSH